MTLFIMIISKYFNNKWITRSKIDRVIFSLFFKNDRKNKEYEGCSNMNASSFITFVKCMLRQNGICFYKGLYVPFKLAPDLMKNTVYLSSYSPLNEGHFSIITNSMLRTYQ